MFGLLQNKIQNKKSLLYYLKQFFLNNLLKIELYFHYPD